MRSQTILTTRRLRLRQWQRADLTLYARHCNTPDVMGWLGGVMTPRQVRLDVSYFERQQLRNGFTFWVLERKSDKAFLGFCGLVRVAERSSTVIGQVEIGWRVRSDMWRRGYAFEAASKVLCHGFEHLALERIVSRVAAGNVASRHLMEKLCMTRTPSRDYVHPHDRTKLLVYTLEHTRWRELQANSPT
jgi:RimJ/RimL family protein N-acetyltransferase